jgi:hypothetical protein
MFLGVGNYGFKVFFDAPVRIADLDLQQKAKKSMNWVWQLFFIHHSSVSPTQLPPSSEKQKGEEEEEIQKLNKKESIEFLHRFLITQQEVRDSNLVQARVEKVLEEEEEEIPIKLLEEKKSFSSFSKLASPPTPIQSKILWKSVSLSKHTKKRELLLYDQGANRLLSSSSSSSCKKQITWNTHSGVHLIKDENKSSSSAPLLLVQLQIQNMDKILPSPENTTDWLNWLPTKCKRWKKHFQSYSCIANNPPSVRPSVPSSLKLLLLLKAQTTFPQTQNQNKTKPILSSSLPPTTTQSFH